MATEPECMVPIRLAEHVVLIGDHNQLQPVLSNRDAQQMGLGRSLFERYVDKGVRVHMLQIQYRMVSTDCMNARLPHVHSIAYINWVTLFLSSMKLCVNSLHGSSTMGS